MSSAEEQNANSKMRRSDRAADDKWITEFLNQARCGVLAMSRDNQPFVTTNTFVYSEDDHAIYFHGTTEGMTCATVKDNPKVCFTVNKMGRLLPAENAMNMSVEFECVVAFGQCEIITDKVVARRCLQMMIDKYFSHLTEGTDYSPMTEKEIDITAVYKLKITEWSGKNKQAEQDFPGAFECPFG